MTRISAVIMDKDGTLLDFEATWAPVLKTLAIAAAGGDLVAAEALLVAGGLDVATGRYRHDSTIGAGTTKQIAQLFNPELRGRSLARASSRLGEALRRHVSRHAVAIDGAPQAMSALAARGLAIGVVTNDETRTAKESLVAAGFDLSGVHVFGSDAVARPKPAPDMVMAFAAVAGISPSEIVVVGDNATDLRMARAAGAGFAVGVISGNGTTGDLGPLADAVLDSVRDMPEWVGRQVSG